MSMVLDTNTAVELLQRPLQDLCDAFNDSMCLRFDKNCGSLYNTKLQLRLLLCLQAAQA